MANFTGIYADTLTATSFDDEQFDGIAIQAGVPVRMYYRVLPGQEISFGSGSSSLGGVRTAKIMCLNPKDSNNAAVQGTYRLMYIDANKVRSTVLRQDVLESVRTLPSAYTSDVQAQSAYLPETVGMTVGAYAYLCIEFTPSATVAGQTFSTANSQMIVPITVYTLANASGQ